MPLFEPPRDRGSVPDGVQPSVRRDWIVSTDPARVSELIQGRERCFLYQGDCRHLLGKLPKGSVQLIITSPPYNIGKSYEEQKSLRDYLELQAEVIGECARVLSPRGSICWEVGNHIVGKSEILPLDIPLHALFAGHGLKLRNRIVWHFEHGLHCRSRFSGRYEVILWYTRTDEYTFHLDPVRVPQKYPGKKHFKGPNAGRLSGHPLGKNPSDVWVFPNVKHNHREKTIHPCQFPVELVDRFVLATTDPGDVVLDPFAGVATTLAASLLRGRRSCGAEVLPEYVEIGEERIRQALDGTLPVRPMGQAVYQPGSETVASLPFEFLEARRNADQEEAKLPARRG